MSMSEINPNQLKFRLEVGIPTTYGIYEDLGHRAINMIEAIDKTLAANRNGSIKEALHSPKHKKRIKKRLSPESITQINDSAPGLYEEGYESFRKAYGAEVMKKAMIKDGMHPDDAEIEINNTTRIAYYGIKEYENRKNFKDSFIGPDNEDKRTEFRNALNHQKDLPPTIEPDDTIPDTSEQ